MICLGAFACASRNSSTNKPSIAIASCAILRYFVGVSRDSSSRFSVDLPAAGAQSGRHAASLPARNRHHRIMAQIVVVVEVLISQRYAEHPLADQRTHRVFDISAVTRVEKQPAKRRTRPIALSAAPNSNPPASDVTVPPLNSATTGLPSTGANSLGFALHSVCIGEPLCVSLSRSRKTTYR